MTSRPAYDDKERARIRSALQRYREEHGVGVPTLQLRIAEAIGDEDPNRVPLKSLQRFLADSHRTDDALVDHCAAFLSMVAPPPAGAELGRALSGYFGEQSGVLDAFNGRYLVQARAAFTAVAAPATVAPMAATGQHGAAKLASTSPFRPFAVLNLENADEDTHLNALESVFDPQNRHHAWSGNTGLFIQHTAEGFLMILRSYVDSRFYFLKRLPSGDGFEGVMVHTASQPTLLPSMQPTEDTNNYAVQLLRTPIKE